MKENDKVLCLKDFDSTTKFYHPTGCPKKGQVCCVSEVMKVGNLTVIKLVGFPLVEKTNGKYGWYNGDKFKLLGRVQEIK